MFQVEDYTINMTCGDTGAIDIHAVGYEFASNDRAMFAVRNRDGIVVKQGVYEIMNGVFTVYFQNDETDHLPAGEYFYDVRYVINPYYDSDGKIINGDQVITPKGKKRLILWDPAGDV